MKNADLKYLQETILYSLAKHIEDNKLKVKTDFPDSNTIIVKSDYIFSIDIYQDEAIVLFYTEHEHFLLMNYKSVDLFVDAIAQFASDIYHNPLIFEYIYFHNTIISLRIYIFYLSSHKKKLLKTIFHTLNPLYMLTKKTKKIVTIDLSSCESFPNLPSQ